MTTADVQNNLFGHVSNTITSGIVPDLHTAMLAILVVVMVLVIVDMTAGKMFRQWQEQIDERDDYEKYKKHREKAEKFKNTYSAEHDFTGPSAPSGRSHSNHLGL